ncbi:hypothetical protein Pla108_35580 [Botrimarina colliarenosi]|uniref:PEP-CTERM protein-sorting domain-containing protein n=1 Tax=Botrimarina colliarenosi TaxID=2528001 RepID=A0A5C6A7P5_9BACT|nr:PEP-CTERM sorting domain-containing protein [Botrimarina colliarenosi]TWT95410.1 hypothetical protein Pla108_35580 [Botrimarina colliarenosi]
MPLSSRRCNPASELMARVVLAIAALACCSGGAAATSLVAFRFTGSLFDTAEVFGYSIGPADTVTGHVVYRTGVTNSVPLGDCLDCAGYPVDLVSGFRLEVGPLVFRYDSFAAAVFDDGPGFDPTFPEDVLRFGRNELGPWSYERRLLVNGEPHAAGFADVSFVGSSLALFSTALPNDPVSIDFFIGNLLISDGVGWAPGFVDPFSLERLTVPAGDYFLDGYLCEQDYAVWRNDYGATFPSSADGNGDGVVDAADYTIWRDAMALSASGVPEPSGVAGVMMVALLTTILRKRRHAL